MIQSYYVHAQDRIGWYKLSWRIYLACLVTSFFVMIEPAPTDLLFVLALAAFALAPLRPQRLFGAMAVLGIVIYVWFTILSLLLVAVSYSVALRAVGIEMYLLLLFAMTAYFVRHDGDRAFRTILIALAIGGVVTSIVGILAWLGLIPNRAIFFRDDHLARISSTFKDPNVLGPYLIPSIMLMIWLLLSYGRKQILVAGALAVMLGCLLLTFSRGAWAHMVLSSMCFFLLLLANRRTTSPALLAALALIGCGLLGVLFFDEAIFGSASDSYLSSRLSLQSYDDRRFSNIFSALGEIFNQPFGIGANQARLVHGFEPHNTFVVLAMQNGLLAAVGFAIFFFAGVYRCVSMVLRQNDGWLKYAFVLSILIGLFLLMNVVGSLHWRHLYVILALSYGNYQSNDFFAGRR